ncbi:MAG: hypothetical protein WC887_03195 [Candidatus Paceibacterota bacterium]|jgi:hypothetical protein
MNKNTILIAIIIIIIVCLCWYSYHYRKLHATWTGYFFNKDIERATFPTTDQPPISMTNISGREFIIPCGAIASAFAWSELGGVYLRYGQYDDAKDAVIYVVNDENEIPTSCLEAYVEPGWNIPQVRIAKFTAGNGQLWKLYDSFPSATQIARNQKCASPMFARSITKWPAWVAQHEVFKSLITPIDGKLPEMSGAISNVKYPELSFASDAHFRQYRFGVEMVIGAQSDAQSDLQSAQFILVPTDREMEFFVYQNGATIHQLIAKNGVSYSIASALSDADVARWKLTLTTTTPR